MIRANPTEATSALANVGITLRPSGDNSDRPDGAGPVRPDAIRPDALRPDVNRPELDRPGLDRPDVLRPGIERGGDNIIEGTEGDDILYGTDSDDVIWAHGGADGVRAGGGDDLVRGGNGNDTLSDSTGNDSYSGGEGADTFVFGYTNRASAENGSGRDRIRDFSREDGDQIQIQGDNLNARFSYGDSDGDGADDFTIISLIELSDPARLDQDTPAPVDVAVDGTVIGGIMVYGALLTQSDVEFI